MKTRTISTAEFLSGSRYREPSKTQHEYHAEWGPNGITVYGKDGQQVEIQCAGTLDNRTAYVCVKATGEIIGGWTYPHAAMPWKYLITCINQGICYKHTNDLPKRRAKTRA